MSVNLFPRKPLYSIFLEAKQEINQENGKEKQAKERRKRINLVLLKRREGRERE